MVLYSLPKWQRPKESSKARKISPRQLAELLERVTVNGARLPDELQQVIKDANDGKKDGGHGAPGETPLTMTEL